MKLTAYILTFCIFLLFSRQSDAAENLKTNYSITDSLLTSSATEICSYITENNISNVDITLSGTGGESILKQRIADCAVDSIRKFHQSANLKGKMPNLLDILIDSISVFYENDPEDSDKLIRKIDISISMIYTDKSNIIREPVRIKKLSVDKIFRDQAENVMNKDFHFTVAEVPDEPESFWHDILEPAVIIGSAVAVVILLFTVRSD